MMDHLSLKSCAAAEFTEMTEQAAIAATAITSNKRMINLTSNEKAKGQCPLVRLRSCWMQCIKRRDGDSLPMNFSYVQASWLGGAAALSFLSGRLQRSSPHERT